MSLTTVKLSQIVRRQYLFKLRANTGLFSSLIILQVFGVLFSLSGIGSRGGSFFHISYYTADFMIGFTMIWAFMIAVQLMSKDYRDPDFTFVTNRLVNNLSNVLFLITASIVGAITALLSGYLLKVIIHLSFKTDHIHAAIAPTPKQLIFGFTATILYVFLFSMLGYVVGAIIQLNKIFIVLLPIFLIGFLIMAARTGQDNLLIRLFEFYFTEAVFFLYLLKIVITNFVLFIGAILLSNRLEVKQ